MGHLKPSEILEVTIKAGETKAKAKGKNLLLLGILAGIFIALAGAGANSAAFFFLTKPETVGIGRMISGIVFPAGLIMVILAGAELFTGNCLMVGALIERKITLKEMLRNWAIVYFANLIGSIFIAWLFVYSGLLGTGGGMLQEVTVSIATTKTSLAFGPAFVRGILCNLLVCLAVWMANGASSTGGKVLAAFFPIFLFVVAGFEHSIANMFFIPAGIFADGGLTVGLTWGNFFLKNLLPVTLGNIVGGSLFVAGAYTLAYKK